MAKAKMVKELTFDTPDRPGLLSEISEALAKAKVNVSYLCAWAMDDRAYFMMVTENNSKAKKALSGLGYKAKEDGIIGVELPNKAGAMRDVARKIADAGINISFVDCTAIGKSAMGFLSTSDDKKAIKAINK